MKTCKTCETDKPLSEFYKMGKGHAAHCKPCYNKLCTARQLKNRRENPQKWLEYDRKMRSKKDPRARKGHQLKSQFGVSIREYEVLLMIQEGGCAICGTSDPGSGKVYFSVDHDHSCCPGKKSCGKCVRGLLCGRCNFGLGLFKDDTNALKNAVNYLEKYAALH